ncbi:hypothetical protein V2J09_003878, partial [Rumex salicifolius]
YCLCSWQALKEAFEVFCNKDVAGSSSAELLATICDNILKKGGSEKLSDEAIEETFEKSANDDHERSILTKLKQQCGGQFISKMEGMVCFFVMFHWSCIFLQEELMLPCYV